jgi:hypothetical protein
LHYKYYFSKLAWLAEVGGIEGSGKWVDEANPVQDKAVLKVLAQNQRDLVQPGRRPHLRIPVIQPVIPYPPRRLEDNQGRDRKSGESADQGGDLAVRVAGAQRGWDLLGDRSEEFPQDLRRKPSAAADSQAPQGLQCLLLLSGLRAALGIDEHIRIHENLIGYRDPRESSGACP